MHAKKIDHIRMHDTTKTAFSKLYEMPSEELLERHTFACSRRMKVEQQLTGQRTEENQESLCRPGYTKSSYGTSRWKQKSPTY